MKIYFSAGEESFTVDHESPSKAICLLFTEIQIRYCDESADDEEFLEAVSAILANPWEDGVFEREDFSTPEDNFKLIWKWGTVYDVSLIPHGETLATTPDGRTFYLEGTSKRKTVRMIKGDDRSTIANCGSLFHFRNIVRAQPDAFTLSPFGDAVMNASLEEIHSTFAA